MYMHRKPLQSAKGLLRNQKSKNDISEWNGKGVHLDEIAKKTKPASKAYSQSKDLKPFVGGNTLNVSFSACFSTRLAEHFLFTNSFEYRMEWGKICIMQVPNTSKHLILAGGHVRASAGALAVHTALIPCACVCVCVSGIKLLSHHATNRDQVCFCRQVSTR